jgi:DNA polymerase III delta prime subunit
MCLKRIKSFFIKKKKEKPSLPVIDTGNVNNKNNSIKPATNLANMNSKDKKLCPEFDYLEKLISYRLKNYFPAKKNDADDNQANEFHPVNDFPSLETWYLPWEKFARENNLSDKREELIILLTGITPHLQPDLFDKIITKTINEAIDFPNIGGVRGKNSRFFLPTGQTALFLIADDNLDKRLRVQQLFGAEHIFWEKKIIWLEDMQNGEPAMHGRLIVAPDYVDLFTYGSHQSPQFSISFPAKKIAPVKQDNPPSFNELVIPYELKEQIDELKNWLSFNDELMNRFGMKDKLKKGYRTLFYGPPGTGKTFTAQILGNELKKEVFKIDLSMIVSKYIGETEKNLELLFARAEDKGWILFFDEADALFGKRTNVRDAHDKYANQEVSYLLQRIEDYNGLVILATNMKNNIDDAFIRRFNSILRFPFPDQNQRALIWKKALPKNAFFRKKIVTGNPPVVKEEPADIPELVKKYELTGGNIINIVHFASIKAVEAFHENEKAIQEKQNKYATATVSYDSQAKENSYPENPTQLIIYLSDVLDGIKRELIKEGKPFSL